MFKKILYVGAGLHTKVLEDFSETRDFVFIDSRPRNEYGNEYYYRPLYRGEFTNMLSKKLLHQGFEKYEYIQFTNKYEEIKVENLNSSCLFYYNKCGKNLRSERELKYFISTSDRHDLFENDYLHKELQECDNVVVSGYYPHSNILRYLTKPFHFVGYNTTVYSKNLKSHLKKFSDDHERNSIMTFLHKFPEIIKSYTLVDYNTGEKKTFNTYSEFYKMYKNDLRFMDCDCQRSDRCEKKKVKFEKI